MKTKIDKAKEEKRQDEQIKAILFLLESHLQGQLDEVQKSYTLMDLGAKTELIKEIESYIDDPFSKVFGAAYSLNKTILGLLNNVFSRFFKQNLDIVQAAYLVPENALLLDYYVILKNEEEATLDRIYGYFAEYDQKHLSEIYRVRFSQIETQHIPLLPENRIQIV